MDDIAIIRSKIAVALQHETQTQTLKKAIRSMAAANARSLSETQLGEIMAEINATVQWVPVYLDALSKAAAGTPFAQPAKALRERLVAYWVEENDLIPDSSGLTGLLDDAYCSLASLAKLSAACAAQTGSPLVDASPAAACADLRILMGEPITARLDKLIAADMVTSPWADLLAALVTHMATAPRTSHPVWGNMNTGDIVNHRMALLRR